jgi:hypothetical protein
MADRYVIFGATYDGDGTLTTEASGATVTITIASPGVVTWNSHGLANNTVVYLETTGALPTGLSGTGTYYVRNAATNTFELSLTSGGASINTSGSQSGTHYCSTAGAWRATNSTGSTLTAVAGTINHGTLSAGDNVYIRSKTGNGADADITFTMTASIFLGSTAATTTAPITWILDNGDKWSGKDGVLKFTHSTSNAWTWNYRTFNHFIAKTRLNWVNEHANASGAGTTMFNLVEGTRIVGHLIDWSLQTARSVTQTIAGNGYFENCRILGGRIASGQLLFNSPSYTPLVLLNTEIELSGVVGTTSAVFQQAVTTPSRVHVIGGRLYGAGATSGMNLVNGGGLTSLGTTDFINFQYPRTVKPATQLYRSSRVAAMGADNGVGAVLAEAWGYGDSRDDGNYPYLNAALPNSTSKGYSFRVWPGWVNSGTPDKWVRFPTSKLYTQDPGAWVVTLEVLIANTISGLNKSTMWMDVTYTDNATGNYVTQTTEVPGSTTALDSSTSTWTAAGTAEVPTWGSVTLLKRKFALTTSGSIKKDSMVTAVLRSKIAVVSDDVTDVYFVDPDIQLTAP